MNPLQLVQATQPLLKNLADVGITVDLCTDFERAKALVEETGRSSQTPMFALGSQDFTAAEAFWLFAFNEDNKAVGASAARMIDLSYGERLDHYIMRTSDVYFGPSRMEAVAPMLGDEMKGRVIYLGELEFSREARGRRDVLAAFVRLIKLLSAAHWTDFDWMFCYVPKEHTKFIGLYQFTVHIPDVITWAEPPPERMASTHAMLAISRTHMSHLLSASGQ